MKIIKVEEKQIKDEGEQKILPKKIMIRADKNSEMVYLEFIYKLHKEGGFIPLMDTFATLIDNGVLERYNGEWIWNEEWQPVKEDFAYQ